MAKDEAKSDRPVTAWTKVTCPSGAVVEIRKMTVADYDCFADENLRRQGTTLDVFLEGCTSLSDKELDRTLQGDRFFLLVEIRKLKSTTFYPRAKCPNCGKRTEQEIDLCDLRLQKLDRSKLSENNEFEIVLPETGYKLRARILDGALERRAIRFVNQNPGKRVACMMLMRTASIEGVKNKTLEWFRALPSEDGDHFHVEYEAHDCGYDTNVAGHCRGCGEDFRFDLPFDQAFFAAPKRTGSGD